MNNPTLAAIVHAIHLFSAVVLLGSAVAIRLAVHPVVSKLEGEERHTIERNIRRRLTMLVHSSLMLLIVTGFFNLARVFSESVPKSYMLFFLIKFFLVMIVTTIAVMLTIQSDALKSFNQKRSFWMLLNIILGAAIVFISAWLRLMPRG